jgi:hypothetical protein
MGQDIEGGEAAVSEQAIRRYIEDAMTACVYFIRVYMSTATHGES